MKIKALRSFSGRGINCVQGEEYDLPPDVVKNLGSLVEPVKAPKKAPAKSKAKAAAPKADS